MPTGCTGQQGPHLPVDFDTWFTQQVSLAAAGHVTERFGVDGLVLPALPFGPTPEHRNYGCGGHDLRAVVEAFNAAHRGRARAFLPTLPYHAIWRHLADPAVPGGHADSFTTSIALHLRPAAVRQARIANPLPTPVDRGAADLDLARHSPTRASADLGARLWAAVVKAAAMTLKTIAAAELDQPV